ncbi:MAG: nucleoside hydrolase [Acidobacteria bacterium]|nr:nucleoside hydrolase [Acidobacteriota bacterium]
MWTIARRWVVLALGLLVLPATCLSGEPRKVIIDTDPGTDDALALLLAMNSPELEVQAVTVVPGNVPLSQGVENALKVASLADRCDIPVAAGAGRPLAQTLVTAELWHGQNGLGGVVLPPAQCAVDPRFGPDLVIELIHKQPGEITLLPIGPLTNIALAVLKDPSIVGLVREVILMGGSLSGGNVTAAAEFNIYNDPEAAQIVFTAGWRVTMAGLDVGNMTIFTRKHLAQLAGHRGPQAAFARAVLEYLMNLAESFGFPGTPVYDPLAVGVAIDGTLVTTRPLRVDVETRGEHTRGETVAHRYGFVERKVRKGDRYVVEGLDPVEPNAEVCVGVEAERFLQLFIERLRAQ